MSENFSMNEWIRGGSGQPQRQRQGQQQGQEQPPKPADLETSALLEVVGGALKAAAAGFEELKKRSAAEDDTADAQRQTKELKPVEEA